MATETGPDEPLGLHYVSTQVSAWIKKLGAVWVEGEVTQINRRGGSSQAYLNVRDVEEKSSVSVVTSPSVIDAVSPELAEGSRIVMHVKAEYWLNQGRLIFRAREIRAVGLGDLIARYEKLRETLNAEGLFDQSRKRPLPFLPRRVGLICGRESAAEKDVIENASRRWPAVEFEVREVLVQGAGAVTEVIAAVADLDSIPDVDVIIITRGGGSFEDLLPFSDEKMIRAVAGVGKPVVSAIGHEQDCPLLDLVADARASTPTHAASLVVPDVYEQEELVDGLKDRAWRAVVNLVNDQDQALQQFRSHRALAHPGSMIEDSNDRIIEYRNRSSRSLLHSLTRASEATEHLASQLRTLSPAATLERGYSIATDQNGNIVTDANSVQPGESLNLQLAQGELTVTAKEKTDD